MYHLVDYVIPAANTIRCPSGSVMAPTNGMVSYSSLVEGGSYVYGTVVTFSCSPGFSLNGTLTRTCGEQGTFSGSTPSCIGERAPSCTVITPLQKTQQSPALLSLLLGMGRLSTQVTQLHIMTTKQQLCMSVTLVMR